MRRAVALLWLAAACGGAPDAGGGAAGAPAPSGPPHPGVAVTLRFVDGTAASGLGAFQQRSGAPEKAFIDESFGAGVALVDVDGDGDLDAYLTNGGSGEPGGGADAPADALFLNEGRGHFVDGTAAAGLGDRLWSYGVTACDVDGDGDQDLYVSNHGPNRLYRNRGDGTFEEVAAELGVADPRWSTGARFLDYDRDGDLDLYLANHILFDREAVRGLRQDYFDLEVYYGPLGLDPAPDALYRQEPDGRFTDVSAESGVAQRALYAFHVVTFDWDRDGWPDLYVANDSHPNVLWHNRGDGTFEDVALQCGVALSSEGNPQAGMGVAVGDYDGDGREDLYVTNFSEDYYTLYQAAERGLFRDTTARAGLYRPTLNVLGWGALFEDLDADGDLDLFAANGHVFPQVDRLGRSVTYLQRNQLFDNLGQGHYRELGDHGGPGLALAAASRGVAAGDVDGDGDRDLLVGNLDGPPTLLLNESASGGALVLELIGPGRNRDAIGARVAARTGERTLVRTAGDGSGFLSSGDRRLHLGLGAAARVDELVVTWPDGSETRLADQAPGRLLVIAHGQGLVREAPLGH